MKIKHILLLLLCFGFFSSSAQFGAMGGGSKKTIKGNITGQLIDAQTNQPVGYAAISVRKAGRKKIINGVLTDDDGKFKIETKNGKYDLEVSFLGYEDLKIDSVILTLKNPDKNLGKIQLQPSSVIMDEVEIKETRSLIENKVDKIVFNAEDDSSIAGGDATDVLRKVPMLSVDLEGNVSLRGSQNVRILINGKPSGMFSSNVADALKMFPADQIQKVEVITSPGAKYDGEGSGGIINIITKQKNIEGIAGTINASGGNRQNSLNLNLNVGKGRLGITGNGGLFYMVPADANNSFHSEATTDIGTITIDQSGISNTGRLGFNGNLSAFYDFNAYHAINSSLNLRGFSFDIDSEINATVVDQFMNMVSTDRTSDLKNLMSGYDWNTDYTMKFEDNEERELVFATQVSGNVQNQKYLLNTSQSILPIDMVEETDNDGDNLETTLQVDYTHPFSTGTKLEVGAKGVLRKITSDTRATIFDPMTNMFELVPSRSDLYTYNQDVYAGYASLNFILGKKYNFVTGLRYERTDIDGQFRGGEQAVANVYDNFLPNFAVSRTFKNFKTLKLSYSKRIQRPSLFFINPFENRSDPFNILFGNPFLEPELTDQYEIGYNFNIAGFSVFSSGYFKRTTDVIEQVVTPNNGFSENTFQNIGENNSFGINFFTSKSIGKLTLRGGGDVYTYNAKGIVNGLERENEAIVYRLFTNGDFAITGNFKADFFGFFQAPRVTLQGEQPSFSILGVGMRYDWKNTSLGIRIIEPFAANKSFNSDVSGPGFSQQTMFSIPFRSFGLNVRYKFGKVDFKKRRSKIKNTDQKSGEGQGGQGAAGGMGQ